MHLVGDIVQEQVHVGPFTPGARMPKPVMKAYRDGPMVIEDADNNIASDLSWFSSQLNINEGLIKLHREVKLHAKLQDKRID